jgi:hypothetical protein
MIRGRGEGDRAESIERFIEDQAFSPSYDLDTPPPSPPPLPQRVVSLSQSSCVSPVELHMTEEGEGGAGGGAKSYDHTTHAEKAWSSINHSKLSGEGGEGEKVSGMVVAAEHLILSQRTLL